MFIAKHIPAVPSHHWTCCFAIAESFDWAKENVVSRPMPSDSFQFCKTHLLLWDRRILNCVSLLSWFVDVDPDKHAQVDLHSLTFRCTDKMYSVEMYQALYFVFLTFLNFLDFFETRFCSWMYFFTCLIPWLLDGGGRGDAKLTRDQSGQSSFVYLTTQPGVACRGGLGELPTH